MVKRGSWGTELWAAGWRIWGAGGRGQGKGASPGVPGQDRRTGVSPEPFRSRRFQQAFDLGMKNVT